MLQFRDVYDRKEALASLSQLKGEYARIRRCRKSSQKELFRCNIKDFIVYMKGHRNFCNCNIHTKSLEQLFSYYPALGLLSMKHLSRLQTIVFIDRMEMFYGKPYMDSEKKVAGGASTYMALRQKDWDAVVENAFDNLMTNLRNELPERTALSDLTWGNASANIRNAFTSIFVRRTVLHISQEDVDTDRFALYRGSMVPDPDFEINSVVSNLIDGYNNGRDFAIDGKTSKALAVLDNMNLSMLYDIERMELEAAMGIRIPRMRHSFPKCCPSGDLDDRMDDFHDKMHAAAIASMVFRRYDQTVLRYLLEALGAGNSLADTEALHLINHLEKIVCQMQTSLYADERLSDRYAICVLTEMLLDEKRLPMEDFPEEHFEAPFLKTLGKGYGILSSKGYSVDEQDDGIIHVTDIRSENGDSGVLIGMYKVRNLEKHLLSSIDDIVSLKEESGTEAVFSKDGVFCVQSYGNDHLPHEEAVSLARKLLDSRKK